MSIPRPGVLRASTPSIAKLAALCSILMTVTASCATATPPRASASSVALRGALGNRAAAERSLKSASKALIACTHEHPSLCAADRQALAHAQQRLSIADRRLATVDAKYARHHQSQKASDPASPITAPTPVSKAGESTGSTGEEPASTSKTEAEEPQATTPAESAESSAMHVTSEAANQLAAPTIKVSGDTLSWASVRGVSKYVFVTKVPGHEDAYSIVDSSTITPPTVPGTTVRYSVRTDVENSAWAPEVTIAYPAETSTTPPPAGSTETTSTSGSTEASTSSFVMGVVAGADPIFELPFLEKLGTRTARVEFGIDTPVSQMTSTIEAYAKAGIQPMLLASFYGRLPSSEEARNLATWAAAFGPGGTFWKGRSLPTGTALTHIEFGNETSYTYQFSNNSSSEYASRAQTYALRFKEAEEAIHASEPQVGLLAQADSGGLSGNAWVENMFKAVPNLGQLVAGWTVHPYGPEWEKRINQLVSGTAAMGASSTIPIYVTEWGLDTDNGRCLEYNYGWNTCMTYEEAATALGKTVSAMRARYGSRLAALYLYQSHDQQPTGTSTSLESYFGALQNNGAPKGAYTTEVESLISANP